MWIAVAWMALNLTLLTFVAARLRLHHAGIFSVGAISLGSVLLPHYILYPLYLVATDERFLPDDHFMTALAIVTAMLTALLLGTLSTHRTTLPRFLRMSEHRGGAPVVFVLLSLTLVALLGVAFIGTGSYNPLQSLLMARSAPARLAYLRLNLAYPQLLLFGAANFLLALAIVRIYRRGGPRAFLTALAVTLTCCFVLLSYGSRAVLFGPLLIFFFLTHHLHRRIRMTLLVPLVIAAVPVFVLVRLVGGGHPLSELIEEGWATDREFITKEFVARFNGFEGLVDLAGWSENEPLGAGRTLGQMAVRWVPRRIMPDKPQSADVYLSEQIYGRPEFGGGIMIYGGAGEMYYNFRLLGVLLWFFILGRLLYRVHFGTATLLAHQRLVGVALIVSNPVLLRGLVNLGVNTIAMQQLLMTLAAQAFILLILTLSGARKRPAELRIDEIDRDRVASLLPVGEVGA
jgi:hypothetical protein